MSAILDILYLAAIRYSQFWVIFRIVSMIATLLSYYEVTRESGNCINALGCTVFIAIFEPYIVYRTLLRDSRWWQGLHIRSGHIRTGRGAFASPLDGIDIDVKSAQILAESLDDLGHEEVKLLNFAYIELDRSKQLGSGSFSKVYRGTYRKQECAIKLVFTVDLTEDVISRVVAEAQILSQIKVSSSL